MADLKNPKWMYAKAALFLVIGVTASTLIIIDHPTVQTVVLLGLAIWAFARAYYFAFYVIQHFIDAEYRFAGLFDFARYLMRGEKDRK